ncbi:NADH-ubiquinone oxidoreductase complex I subunit, putative [Trypanosoma equiperdum]|uniref:NADH-ubiquinone oxidoreductase complex I subunit n=3 Tax=Trypanozoon TaxID=39700 RepID=Q57WA2_TRYB2|nr:hypothetical protein, conserved [Trypanosoma brucei brucei TREU927]AAX70080.1 hypothetical protein, conserved [Trypanosoma brucei]AAZ10399.1 hypothetical protein, conserved [Trypanosoma brucei brucei TREU927]RHW73701.1 NADH-ubiquinone oxidoreductase complex I subunit [Trypanosoma brucei equiperdum]SCU66066.1 NADH-ubiquinone oxidoreductase complex I subunit, putative [Trypanosoma equiperdum]
MLTLRKQTLPVATATLLLQRRGVEYWGSSVTGRTQPYAQGDLIPRVDNMRHVVSKSSSAAANLTGSNLGVAYDSDTIFSVAGYSRAEKEHYRPLRGIARYKIEPMAESDTVAAQGLLEQAEMSKSISFVVSWWGGVLKDFPSLKKVCDDTFKEEFTSFYKSALSVAHDDAAVKALAVPFVRRQMQEHYISFPMFWRIAEKLADAIEKVPQMQKPARSVSRIAVERVTKIALNTIADEPWALDEMTSPLLFDVSNFRAWHEAGNW